MAKKKSNKYLCTGCGHIEPRWMGKCPECGSWNSFLEQVAGKEEIDTEVTTPIPIPAIQFKEEIRFDTGIDEINRVLGGGAIRGSSILVGGEPGIGKSTLMLQITETAKVKGRVLYISGEESLAQIKLRADRLGIHSAHIEVYCNTILENILDTMEKIRPVLVIIDSIQTLHSRELSAVAGTVSQVKHCASALNEFVKAKSIALFLIGHVTKDGLIAGPKVVEHLVDTVLYFDQASAEIRVVRAVKNRFGSTDEIGLFNMTETGLIQVKDPLSLFLEHREGTPPPGVAIAPVYEGSRVLLVEIQCLVVPAKGGISRVFSDRIDSRRIFRLAAVLEKHMQLPFSDMDIYVNIAGGIKITEVGIDLPLSLALFSAKQNLSLPAEITVLGEVSLAGEIRAVSRIESRVKASLDLGFKLVIGPCMKTGEWPDQYCQVKTIQEAVKKSFTFQPKALPPQEKQ